jgi:predicted transcriptional regulator
VTSSQARYIALVATTLKVSEETPDRVKALGDAQHRTADHIINAGLDALQRQRRRDQMREESRAGLADPADPDAIRRVREEMDDLRAW